MSEHEYSFSEVVALSGATENQMIHWTAKRWLPSLRGTPGPGSGNHNVFSDADVAAAKRAVRAAQEYGKSAPKFVFAGFKEP